MYRGRERGKRGDREREREREEEKRERERYGGDWSLERSASEAEGRTAADGFRKREGDRGKRKGPPVLSSTYHFACFCCTDGIPA